MGIVPPCVEKVLFADRLYQAFPALRGIPYHEWKNA
jgi:hypothetical protein